MRVFYDITTTTLYLNFSFQQKKLKTSTGPIYY